LRFMSWWTAYSLRETRDMLTAAIANVVGFWRRDDD
jgi:hypothetical protein